MDIDSKMKKLLENSDSELISLAKKHLQQPVSNTPTTIIKKACESFSEGKSLDSEIRSHIAMFISFEELTLENQK